MGEDRLGLGRDGLRLVVGVADRIVEDRHIAGRLHVVAQRLDRPVNDVGVAVGSLHLAVPVEHEPLRPVAGLPELMLVDGPDHVS